MVAPTDLDIAALDAWLAEHLFGCVEIATSGSGWLECDGQRIRSYSTTGEVVLEAMQGRGWDWYIESVDGVWWLRLEHGDGRQVGYSPLDGNSILTGPTLSTAVALAAKVALEAEARGQQLVAGRR